MNNIGQYAIPVLIAIVLIVGLIKKVPIFEKFLEGAKEGLHSTFAVAPSLIGLITAIAMLKSSGALDIFSSFIAPITNLVGIPSEIIPLALLRPITGSGSTALLNNILATHGANSQIGQIASVIMGSTETAFYTIAVYFGASGIKNSRHAIPCALTADLAALIVGTLVVKLLF